MRLMFLALFIMATALGCEQMDSDYSGTGGGVDGNRAAHEQFYNGLSGEFMTWVECDGTDGVGPLPPEQFWAPAESDWLGKALGRWFSQGRCLGYPNTCSPTCIGVDNDLDIDQPDFTPVDEIAGAGAPSTSINDHGADFGIDSAMPLLHEYDCYEFDKKSFIKPKIHQYYVYADPFSGMKAEMVYKQWHLEIHGDLVGHEMIPSDPGDPYPFQPKYQFECINLGPYHLPHVTP
jgi:hypothetical protein